MRRYIVSHFFGGWASRAGREVGEWEGGREDRARGEGLSRVMIGEVTGPAHKSGLKDGFSQRLDGSLFPIFGLQKLR